MKLRRILVIGLLLFAPLVCSSPAYAEAMTTRYVEDLLMMRWDFHCNMLATCNGVPPGQNAWSSQILVGVTQDFFVITSRHVAEAHIVDVGNGALFSFGITFADFERLLVQNDIVTRITVGTVIHPAAPTDHFDVYTLFASRSAQGGFDFRLVGQHVPEPTSMLLLGTGLAAIAVKLRKRRGIRNE